MRAPREIQQHESAHDLAVTKNVTGLDNRRVL